MSLKRGFTLIELLVVISIIALLSTVVLSSLNSARDKGRLAAGRQFEGIVYRAVADSAVAIWDFDECSGTVANDRSLSGNNGTLSGSTLPTWSTNTASGQGCSLNFNGSTAFVDGGANTVLADNSPFTYSVWINYSGSQQTRTIMGRHLGTSNGASMGIDDGIADRIKFHLQNYSTQRVTSTITVNDGKWHHIAGVWDGTRLSLYIDGALNVSATPATTLVWPTNNFQIGRWVGGSSQYFSGLIDNARVFSKALTASEIGALYAAEGQRNLASNEGR